MTGRYVEINFPWYESRILNCSFCGKMIAGEYWNDDEFTEDKFCEPSCVGVKLRLKYTTSKGTENASNRD